MNLDLASVLLISLFALPMILVLLPWLSKRQYLRWFFAAEICLLLIILISLLIIGEQDINTSLFFMQERITFSIASTPVLLFLLSIFVLAGYVITFTFIESKEITKLSFILINLTLSFGAIAFFSGQFMIRYMALDIVGLLVALTALQSFKNQVSYKSFTTIFQVLRLGDLSLLAAILIINQAARTLDISKMIVYAADMPIANRSWVFILFLLAVWIKLGVFPFDVWIQHTIKLSQDETNWISWILMPGLGYYLFYRILPIVNSRPVFQYALLTFGLITFLSVLILDYFKLRDFNTIIHSGSLSGSLLFCGLALVPQSSPVYLLLGLIGFRLFVILDSKSSKNKTNRNPIMFPIILGGLYFITNMANFSFASSVMWFSLILMWIIGEILVRRRVDNLIEGGDGNTKGLVIEVKAFFTNISKWMNKNFEHGILDNFFQGKILISVSGWLNRNIEIGLFSDGLSKFAQLFQKISRINREFVEEKFEGSLVWVSNKLLILSEGTLLRAEVNPSEGTDKIIGGVLQSLETYEQKVLKKQLRWDLVWIPLLLILILIFLVLV
jgi:hypothetical protein